MIPEGMLHTKPIYLRHKCLFYIGHIPTFLDIHLTRVLRKVGKRKELECHTEPKQFMDIFERGIDPDVDDPSVIHVSQWLIGHIVVNNLVAFVSLTLRSQNLRKTGQSLTRSWSSATKCEHVFVVYTKSTEHLSKTNRRLS